MNSFKRKYKTKKYNVFNLCYVGIILGIAFLTVGFSAQQASLDISDIAAEVRIKKDIRIIDVTPFGSSNNGTSNWEDYNTNEIHTGISLPNSNSTVTYDVSIVNLGNVEASINDILGLPNNLEYTLNNYELREMLCDDNDTDLCKLGSTSTVSITIGYAENGYNSNNTDYTVDMNFNFGYMVDSVAMMGNSFYDTLQGAIAAAPSDKTETNIMLLNNTSEVITIANTKNIVLNLNSKTLGNNGNNPVISNNGILYISNGTVATDAIANGAINNESSGVITLNGVNVNVTGGRQALYNNSGTATITGGSYLSSVSNQRAAVQNVTKGTLNVLNATIISTGFSGLVNDGTLTIGIKDGNMDANYPDIQGISYGLNTSTNVKFYDGIIRGRTSAINNLSKLVELEDGYGIVHGTDTIDNITYDIATLGVSNKVTFDANKGTVTDGIKYVVTGDKVGTLPVAARLGYDFVGWFTSSSGGNEITVDTIINGPITFYAHWNKMTDVVRIGTVYYDTVQEAINAASSNTQVTITMLKDVSENITVDDTKDIIIDLNGKTLSNFGKSSVVENSGNLTFINGTVTSNTDVGAINNNAGRLTIGNGARIVATGSRQAIYINDGIVEVTGTAYLSSQTSGKPSGSTMERGTIQCLSAGTLIVTGGTIESSKQQAISNEGTLIIGSKDGTVNTTTPVLVGSVYGVKSTGTFNYYDGIIKGKTNAINGTVSDQEDNTTIVTGTEVINNVTYKTVILQNS